MREAGEETGIKDCVIVTWDAEKEFEEDGVWAVPFWKWTLEDAHTADPAAVLEHEYRKLVDADEKSSDEKLNEFALENK